MNAPTVYTNSYNTTLGHKCFLTLQTIYTNWERRLAVRASNERPHGFVAFTEFILHEFCAFTYVCPINFAIFSVFQFLTQFESMSVLRNSDCNGGDIVLTVGLTVLYRLVNNSLCKILGTALIPCANKLFEPFVIARNYTV